MVYDPSNPNAGEPVRPVSNAGKLFDVYAKVVANVSGDAQELFAEQLWENLSLPEYRRERTIEVQVPPLKHLNPPQRNRTGLSNRAQEGSPLTAKLVILYAGHNLTTEEALSSSQTKFAEVPSIAALNEVVYSFDIDLITWLWRPIDAMYPSHDDVVPAASKAPSSPHVATRLPFHLYSETSTFDERQLKQFAQQDRAYQEACMQTFNSSVVCEAQGLVGPLLYGGEALSQRMSRMADGNDSPDEWRYFPLLLSPLARRRPKDYVPVDVEKGVPVGHDNGEVFFTLPLTITLSTISDYNLGMIFDDSSETQPPQYANMTFDLSEAQRVSELNNLRSGDFASWKQIKASSMRHYTIPLSAVLHLLQFIYWLRLASTVGVSRRAVFAEAAFVAVVLSIKMGYSYWNAIDLVTNKMFMLFMNFISAFFYGGSELAVTLLMLAAVWGVSRPYMARRGRRFSVHIEKLSKHERRSDRMDLELGWKGRIAVLMLLTALWPFLHLKYPPRYTFSGMASFYATHFTLHIGSTMQIMLQSYFNHCSKTFAGTYKFIVLFSCLDAIVIAVEAILCMSEWGWVKHLPWFKFALLGTQVWQAFSYSSIYEKVELADDEEDHVE
ncbi:hypothetical protein HDU85_003599 [Gaertneriomyces sp. JEL0708]|nr:hypothetical protein HDU85_003599 [Gaertneriomyces sp. JEL0708]